MFFFLDLVEVVIWILMDHRHVNVTMGMLDEDANIVLQVIQEIPYNREAIAKKVI